MKKAKTLDYNLILHVPLECTLEIEILSRKPLQQISNSSVLGFGPLFLNPLSNYDEQEPWPTMTARKYRLFHADITLHAPKDRTLFNYNIKVIIEACVQTFYVTLTENLHFIKMLKTAFSSYLIWKLI